MRFQQSCDVIQGDPVQSYVSCRQFQMLRFARHRGKNISLREHCRLQSVSGQGRERDDCRVRKSACNNCRLRRAVAQSTQLYGSYIQQLAALRPGGDEERMTQQCIDVCNVPCPRLRLVSHLDEWTRYVPSQHASPECGNKILNAFEQEHDVSAG